MSTTDLHITPQGNIIEPDAIPYSFNTLGWHIVAIWLMLFIVVLLVLWLYYYKKNAYRRKAIRKLQKLNTTPTPQNIYQVNYLLKLVAIKVYGRGVVATLYGQQWYSFLAKTAKAFPMPIENSSLFDSALYNPNYQLSEASQTQFIRFAIHWCKTHKVHHV